MEGESPRLHALEHLGDANYGPFLDVLGRGHTYGAGQVQLFLGGEAYDHNVVEQRCIFDQRNVVMRSARYANLLRLESYIAGNKGGFGGDPNREIAFRIRNRAVRGSFFQDVDSDDRSLIYIDDRSRDFDGLSGSGCRLFLGEGAQDDHFVRLDPVFVFRNDTGQYLLDGPVLHLCGYCFSRLDFGIVIEKDVVGLFFDHLEGLLQRNIRKFYRNAFRLGARGYSCT